MSARSGIPVTDPRRKLCGCLSLRDIMKARRSGQMTARVSSHEPIFFSHIIYDLPIVEEDRIVGIVTRDACLRARAGLSKA